MWYWERSNKIITDFDWSLLRPVHNLKTKKAGVIPPTDCCNYNTYHFEFFNTTRYCCNTLSGIHPVGSGEC